MRSFTIIKQNIHETHPKYSIKIICRRDRDCKIKLQIKYFTEIIKNSTGTNITVQHFL